MVFVGTDVVKIFGSGEGGRPRRVWRCVVNGMGVFVWGMGI